MGELIDVTEVSYCSGCDWIVQEWHEGWETHNSKPYDDEAACDLALAEQARRDRDLGLRCIHEADMTKGKWDGAGQWESDRVDLDWCWRCDWRIEEWDYSRWERLNSNTHKTQGLCANKPCGTCLRTSPTSVIAAYIEIPKEVLPCAV